MSARGQEATGRRWGSRRGSVALEFVLTLPVYLLILYAVMTVGDLGLTATQSHIGARMAAWRRTDDITVEQAVAGNLRRVSLEHETINFPTLEVDGKIEQRSAPAWKSMEVPAAFNFSYHTLAAPFGKSGKSPLDLFFEWQRELHKDLLGIDAPHLLDILGVELENKQDRILSNAMLGDLTRSGAAEEKDSGVPWMRRRYAATSMQYWGAANIVVPTGFKAQHTVVLGDGYRSSKPDAYAGGGLFGEIGGEATTEVLGRSLDLRSTPAYGAASAGLFAGHQFETLRMVMELSPSYPGAALTGSVR